MEPGSSLPHSQVPATCHYPEPDQSRPCPPCHFLMIHLSITLPSVPVCGLYPLGFPTKTPYAYILSHIRVTCSAYPIRLDFIIRIICGDEYRSLNYSLCSLLHSSVTLCLLGPNILLSNGEKSSLCFKPFLIRNIQTNLCLVVMQQHAAS